jgi:hypothetical protein
MTKEHTPPGSIPPTPHDEARGGGLRSTRRRLLASGLIGGSVGLLAGTHPVSTLAAPTNMRVCTFSGIMSGNLSHRPMNGCGGFSPGFYKSPDHWPPGPYTAGSCTGNGNSSVCTGGTTFASVFGTAPDGGTTGDTMLQVLVTEENSAAFHYVAALLNSINPNLQGQSPPSGYNYPFTSAQIIQYWQTNRAAGLSLIETFENL